MRWDDELGRLFDDLEQQAEGLALVERDAEVAEQSRAEYAQVDLLGRLHASVGHRLLLEVVGVGRLDGELTRVGRGWCLLTVGTAEWLVAVSALGAVRGLSERTRAQGVRGVTARLGMASALRGVAETEGEVLVHRCDGVQARGVPHRVGADFVDLRVGEGRGGSVETIPFGVLAAVRSA